MNNLAIMETPDELTMSSREIADLTGKRHDHVIRDIEKMLKDLGLGAPKFGGTYTTVQGKEQKEYRLPKNLTMTLVTGYRADLRLRVVDRMMELEKDSRFDPSKLSRGEILQIAMEAEQERSRLQAQVTADAPKVAGYERIALADGSLCFTDAAKTLNMRPKDLSLWLQKNGWAYRRPGNGHFVGYQTKIQQGLLEHKVYEATRSDGSRKITEQCRVTPKGLAKLAELTA